MGSHSNGELSLSFHLKFCFHQGGMFEMRWCVCVCVGGGGGGGGHLKNIFHKTT